MKPRVGSLFSGCAGLDAGLETAGLEIAWQIELDRACRAVLERHYPGRLAGADIREVRTETLAAVDLVAGGSPCQDLSVAGRRQGLDGERSGLFHEFVRIADSQPTAWILWENVCGALSSCEGRDFAVVLRELTGFWPSVPEDGWRSAGVCVGPKRWCVWRVLDSQYFGVAQRRQRVFLVAGPGGTCRPEVLLEPDCLPRNPPPSREAGASVAPLLAGGAAGRGHRVGADEAAGGQVVVARAVQTRGGARMDPDKETYIVSHALRGEGADASEDGSGRGTPLVPVAFTCKQGGEDAPEDLAPPLRAMNFRDSHLNGGGQLAVAYHLAQVTSGENRSNPRLGDPAPALNGDPRLAIAYNVQAQFSEGGGPHARSAEVTKCLDSHGLNPDCQQGGTVLASQVGVRRLAPRECERLQGLEDDWTRWDAEGRELSDSTRYRMIGNGVTKPVAEWIGRRLLAAMEATA